MKRREFIKLSILGGAYTIMPQFSCASSLDISKISFSKELYSSNNAQTIIIYLYGGASQLNANLTNIDEIEKYSQNSYKSYFRGLSKTENGCWQEAGGTHIEKMLQDRDLTLYRTCYSKVREDNGNKAHGVCTEQNQKGNFDMSGAGVISNLAYILKANGVVSSNSIMPFVTMEGESKFYDSGDLSIPSYLKPVGVDNRFNNPYYRERWSIRRWAYYTKKEREKPHYADSDENGGFDPALTSKMDEVAQKHNSNIEIKDAFNKRAKLSKFINSIKSAQIPDLGEDAYPDNAFARNLQAAITLLDKSSDTKVITIGSGGLGGWDDHNEARDYVTRSEGLFKSLRSAMAHLKAIEKDDKINIMVFAEFGRNVNLNSAYGWDHGNLQNLYILGGKDYFNHKGIVGETIVDVTKSLNRLWLKPKNGTYWFEPPSIAATLYKIYGINNPQELTGGYDSVNIV